MGGRNAAHAGLAGHSLPVQSAASLAAMQVTIIAMSSRRVDVRRVDCCQERVQVRRRVVAVRPDQTPLPLSSSPWVTGKRRYARRPTKLHQSLACRFHGVDDFYFRQYLLTKRAVSIFENAYECLPQTCLQRTNACCTVVTKLVSHQ